VTDHVVLYGLRIDSEIPLPQARRAGGDGVADLEVRWGPAMATDLGRPQGELVAEDAVSETAWYRFVRRPDGSYHLRYASVCDFLVTADLGHAVAHPVAGVDLDLVSTLAAGALPAFVLTLRGDAVLHASAVDVGGRAVAFIGPSGTGKSTIATLCCAQGARLVTDDVLRLAVGQGTHDDRPRCYLGAAELRLRRSVAELGDSLGEEVAVRRTGDDRDAVTPVAAEEELLPLDVIVIPQPDRDAARPRLTRLDPVPALLALAACPRLPGWTDPASQAAQFQQLAVVAERVPIYVGSVPWGPPFPAGILDALLAEIAHDRSSM